MITTSGERGSLPSECLVARLRRARPVPRRALPEPARPQQWDEGERSIHETTALLAQRMVEGDKRDERVAALTESIAAVTERMESHGRGSVKLAAASLVVALAALVVAVVVAVTQ